MLISLTLVKLWHPASIVLIIMFYFFRISNRFAYFLLSLSHNTTIKLMNNLKLNKTCGYDDISSFVLKTTIQVLALPLSVMINHCIALSSFPNQLKLAKVMPVYKSGSSVNIQSYRPISLLPSLSKIFERVILNRLVSFLERNSLIILKQFVFSPQSFYYSSYS